MDNLNGLVVNIGKYFYGNKDVPFMQLLLRKQIRVNKNSCYYVFKAGEKFIGFVEVENYDIDNAEKPVRLFACDEFKNSSLENSMISFVASDNPDMKIEILVESDNRSLASTLEGLGFSIGDTIKYYSFHEEDLSTTIDSFSMPSLTKISTILSKDAKVLSFAAAISESRFSMPKVIVAKSGASSRLASPTIVTEGLTPSALAVVVWFVTASGAAAQTATAKIVGNKNFFIFFSPFEIRSTKNEEIFILVIFRQ